MSENRFSQEEHLWVELASALKDVSTCKQSTMCTCRRRRGLVPAASSDTRRSFSYIDMSGAINVPPRSYHTKLPGHSNQSPPLQALYKRSREALNAAQSNHTVCRSSSSGFRQRHVRASRQR